MCRAVAITALRKLLEHFWWMRFAVAGLTWWYAFMFLLVTISTGKIVVFGRICLKQGYGFAMTTPTVMRWDVIGVTHDKRHMNGMAGLTGLKVHVCCVFFMALHAIWDLPMHCVTLVACHVSVGTGLGFHFFPLLRMAREAGTGNVTF
jgi:hypothetical protein